MWNGEFLFEKNPVDFEIGKKRIEKILKNYNINIEPFLKEHTW